jgi:hypothetical protein
MHGEGFSDMSPDEKYARASKHEHRWCASRHAADARRESDPAAVWFNLVLCKIARNLARDMPYQDLGGLPEDARFTGYREFYATKAGTLAPSFISSV